ncbi:cyanophycin synthetase [Akkermansia massiliensis]
MLWLNDSKATNLHALEAALKSQNSPVVLIAGGKDKGLDYLPLRPMLKEKVRACVVFGQIADQLQNAFSPVVPTEKAADVADCVAKARARARTGDTVLFSPGTSSFDMFTGYVQRGQAFRDAVNALSPFPDNPPETHHHENDQDPRSQSDRTHPSETQNGHRAPCQAQQIPRTRLRI